MKFKHVILAIALIIAIALPASIVLTSCTTTQQGIAYNTLYSVEHTTVAAYDGYIQAVIRGQLATNGVPVVSKSFNRFQASFLVALDLVQNNTNAIAPSSLVMESQDVINAIATFKK